MSFSKGGGGGTTNTTNEQNPITATDSAVIANEGSTVQITDGGAFQLVSNVTRDVIDSNTDLSNSAIDAGLNYFDKAIAAINKTVTESTKAVGDTTAKLFTSQQSDELTKEQDFNDTVEQIVKYAVIGIVLYSGIRYLK